MVHYNSRLGDMGTLRKAVRLGPRLHRMVRSTYNRLTRHRFPGSASYWERRYDSGGDSGVGSYGQFAEFKAEVINAFVVRNDVKSVIEFGCGDGNQLSLAKYPSYLGFDISATVIDRCRQRFAGDASKSFQLLQAYDDERAEMALSLDVIYHLVEDSVFEAYMRRLFSSATRFVVIYSSDLEENDHDQRKHIRHRRFTEWIETNVSGWTLKAHIPNKYPYKGNYRTGSFADFFVFERNA
ncbi:MAG: class I SAM-dependent methyltransferase [Kiloniellales bacterium]|nr:class I SAM-dependent methyltransferase [Kiloniellales bacterium]